MIIDWFGTLLILCDTNCKSVKHVTNMPAVSLIFHFVIIEYRTQYFYTELLHKVILRFFLPATPVEIKCHNKWCHSSNARAHTSCSKLHRKSETEPNCSKILRFGLGTGTGPVRDRYGTGTHLTLTSDLVRFLGWPGLSRCDSLSEPARFLISVSVTNPVSSHSLRQTGNSGRRNPLRFEWRRVTQILGGWSFR